MRVALALKGAEWAMNFTAARYPAFAARLDQVHRWSLAMLDLVEAR